MLADTVAVAHARAQPLGTASSRPVGLAGAHAVDAKAVVVAVRWALLLVAVLAAPPGLADAHTVVAAAVGAAADALPGGAVWATPPLVADADAIVARSRVAVAVVRAQADAAVHPAVTRVTDALSSAAEPVQVAVLQVGATAVRAVVPAPWRLAFAHPASALAVAVALGRPAGKLAAVFAGEPWLAEARAFVAVPIRTAVVWAALNGAVDAAEAPLADALPAHAVAVHAPLWALVFHAVLADVPGSAGASPVVAGAMARAHGILHRRWADPDAAVLAFKSRLAHALAVVAQAVAGAVVQAVLLAAVLPHEALGALAFHVHAVAVAGALVGARRRAAIIPAPTGAAVAPVFPVLLYADPVLAAVVRAPGHGAVASGPPGRALALKKFFRATALPVAVLPGAGPGAATDVAVQACEALLALALAVPAVPVPGAIVRAWERGQLGLEVGGGAVQDGGDGDVPVRGVLAVVLHRGVLGRRLGGEAERGNLGTEGFGNAGRQVLGQAVGVLHAVKDRLALGLAHADHVLKLDAVAGQKAAARGGVDCRGVLLDGRHLDGPVLYFQHGSYRFLYAYLLFVHFALGNPFKAEELLRDAPPRQNPRRSGGGALPGRAGPRRRADTSRALRPRQPWATGGPVGLRLLGRKVAALPVRTGIYVTIFHCRHRGNQHGKCQKHNERWSCHDVRSVLVLQTTIYSQTKNKNR